MTVKKTKLITNNPYSACTTGISARQFVNRIERQKERERSRAFYAQACYAVLLPFGVKNLRGRSSNREMGQTC